VWLTKVGPYHNPQETYSYYTLPFCAPQDALKPERKVADLADVLEGHEWVNSDLKVHFGMNVERTPYCSMELDQDSARFLDYAIANHFWYQLNVDGLPVWGMAGEVVTSEDMLKHLLTHGETFEQEIQNMGHNTDAVMQVSMKKAVEMQDKAFLFTHKHFSIGYNGDRVVEVNLTSDHPVHIQPGRLFDLSYSVEWVPVSRDFESRYRRYLDRDFFEHHVHWFSLANSFLLVIFLVGVVFVILARTIWKDIAKFISANDHELEGLMNAKASAPKGAKATRVGQTASALVDDGGWKLVRRDVFRTAKQPELLASMLGTGAQLLVMSIGSIVAALASSLYVDKGALTVGSLSIYGIASVLSGFVSGAYYKASFYPKEGKRWKYTMFLTASLMPSLAGTVVIGMSAVAAYHRTLNAVPVGTMASIFLAWLALSLPLVILGTYLGRSYCGRVSKPMRVNPTPRPVVPRPFYSHPLTLSMMAGVLPFASIFIELYFVLTSFWGYRFYFVYGFMLVVFAMLLIVTACSAVVVTYVILNGEDHRWHWASFGAGASSAMYVFLYATYYFLFRTSMHGMLQTSVYFGYTTLGCVALAMCTGTVGYAAASFFVRTIYGQLKAD